MANPQKENGYTAFANDLLEAIVRSKFTAGEIKVILAIARETYGWSRKKAQISYGELAKITGYSRANAFRACSNLLKMNVIFFQKTGQSHIVGINKNYDEWAVDNLPKSVFPDATGVFPRGTGVSSQTVQKCSLPEDRGVFPDGTAYIPKETDKTKNKAVKKEDVGFEIPVDNFGKEKQGGNGKMEKKRVAEILKGFEECIKGNDPRELVNRFRDEGFDVTRVWGAVVQARVKRNPAGYLVTALGCGKYSIADSAMESAKREMRALNYY